MDAVDCLDAQMLISLDWMDALDRDGRSGKWVVRTVGCRFKLPG